MTRTLVTGSAGRLGRSVVATLARTGHEVVGVDVGSGTPDEAAVTLPADLTDLGETHDVMARFRPDVVVHLAAIATPFSRTDGLTFRTNTQLAFNVCAAASNLGVGRVVVASSPTVIGYGAPGGWRPRYLPIDEEHPTEPWNSYSLSKLTAEQTMAAFARGSATRFAAVRPCFVVAPEEWAGAPTQSGHTMAERLDRPDIAGASLFNYIDARDASELIAVLAERLFELPSGEVFFAGAADALAREPLAELLPTVNPATAATAARLTGTSPAFTSAKAERMLGWTAKRSWRSELEIR
ncbi:NAD-dependent epimerase/dehydratase family protein [Nonomuraea cavernae]|uniref:Nucleoside-diphosphate-sugar epimerase n=1 Tax=Nonomuraea cavernae TaxID=2045107 RepID=A0A917YVZ0_9ACTN|nr:NAD(P)-dependent oxidoreductase [Nonomuraea cavernae]MCA2185270.1 NAD(P)-dependent oxidoreductase [Nonomuraea cavernae]GGO65952.1 nucleoside-diphosphate-sugar epimerase [Nonomuraea cavernae]